uniref:Putative ubiquitin carboxyl-terminal hydrolase FAF-X n=1 Tax=Schistocephalus solidus TaxID=70667 RepID=A0A0X3PZH2_SCHSO
MKALDFLWKLATKPVLFNELMQPALSAHKQILDSCRSQKPLLEWLNRFSEILKEDSNDYDVVCACRQFYDVCSLFSQHSALYTVSQFSEAEVVHQKAVNDDLINVCISNLEHYMQRLAASLVSPLPPSVTYSPLDPISTPSILAIPHVLQIEERLALLRYLAVKGAQPLSLEQLQTLWEALIGSQAEARTPPNAALMVAGQAVCFKWFDPEENELLREHALAFFEQNILKIEPQRLTPALMNLFRRYFYYVNDKLHRIALLDYPNKTSQLLLRDFDLVGMNYLWHLVFVADDRVAEIGIDMLQTLYTNLDQKLLPKQREINLEFLRKCFVPLSTSHKQVVDILYTHMSDVYLKPSAFIETLSDSEKIPVADKMRHMQRIIQMLQRFLVESDHLFQGSRLRLPLALSWCGSTIKFHLNFEAVSSGSAVSIVLDALGAKSGLRTSSSLIIYSHANETLGQLRTRLLILRLRQLGVPVTAEIRDSDNVEYSGDFHFLSRLRLDLCHLGSQCDAYPNHMPLISYFMQILRKADGCSPSSELRLVGRLCTANESPFLPQQRQQPPIPPPELPVYGPHPAPMDHFLNTEQCTYRDPNRVEEWYATSSQYKQTQSDQVFDFRDPSPQLHHCDITASTPGRCVSPDEDNDGGGGGGGVSSQDAHLRNDMADLLDRNYPGSQHCVAVRSNSSDSSNHSNGPRSSTVSSSHHTSHSSSSSRSSEERPQTYSSAHPNIAHEAFQTNTLRATTSLANHRKRSNSFKTHQSCSMSPIGHLRRSASDRKLSAPTTPQLDSCEQFYDGAGGHQPEANLPGCLISEDRTYVKLLFDIGNMALLANHKPLRDGIIDILYSLPSSPHYVNQLLQPCNPYTSSGKCGTSGDPPPRLHEILKAPLADTLHLSALFSEDADQAQFVGPTQVLYALQSLYSYLHPAPGFLCFESSETATDNALVEVFAVEHQKDSDEVPKKMISFLRAGGFDALLSASAFNGPVNTGDSAFSALRPLILLWICRICNLIFTCCLVTLKFLLLPPGQSLSADPPRPLQGDQSGADLPKPSYSQISQIIDVLLHPAYHNSPLLGVQKFLLQRCEDFAHFALRDGVTPKEILTVWLRTSVSVSELLRNTCWISASSSVGLFSADSVNLLDLHSSFLNCANSVKKSASVQQRQQQQRPNSEPAASALSPSYVSTAETSVAYDTETGPSLGDCTFSLSLASSLGSPPVQDFLQSGHIDQISLLPYVDAFIECQGPSSRQNQNNLLPFLRGLALHSGRTPGCLAIEALEALTSAMTLSLDRGLCQLLPPACQEPLSPTSCFPSRGLLPSPSTDTEPPSNREDAFALRSWLLFLIDLLFVCPATYLRIAAREFISLTVTRSLAANCSLRHLCDLPRLQESKQPSTFLVSNSVSYVINFLIKTMVEKGGEFCENTSECTDVIVSLFEFMQREHLPVSLADELLVKEWSWLLNSLLASGSNPRLGEQDKMQTLAYPQLDPMTSGAPYPLLRPAVLVPPHVSMPALFRSHLRICTSLLRLSTGKGVVARTHEKMLRALFETCIFPASKRLRELKTSLQSKPGVSAVILESTNLYVCPDDVLEAAFDFVRELVNCAPNSALSLKSILMELLYSPETRMPPETWDAGGPVTLKPSEGPGFVGLQNAGSTCYMNSVLQQIFSITPIRDAILAVPVGKILEAANSAAANANLPSFAAIGDSNQSVDEAEKNTLSESQLHNLEVLQSVQTIFAYLAFSKRGFYVPSVFWHTFRFWDGSANLREQRDALEFFNCLVDNIDEAMKLCGMPKPVDQVLGGIFEDQTICVDCPHRYHREESFLVMNVVIKNHRNLIESMEEYVKSDLLERANAYFCEKCGKKVAIRKRTCIKRLPLVLAVHLKRFDYDWDRRIAIKSNDYFEFPHELDMEPYTVDGIAKASQRCAVSPDSPENITTVCPALATDQGDPSQFNSDSTLGTPTIEPSGSGDDTETQSSSSPQPTRYTLRGVVVHSGQASSGHYYSYILHHDEVNGTFRWYKYDDTKVSEVDMNSFETVQHQWFGGEFTADASDVYFRFTYPTRVRSWSAYILFYEREDYQQHQSVQSLCQSLDSNLSPSRSQEIVCPSPVVQTIYTQNIEHLHVNMQFNKFFEDFMLNLCLSTGLEDTPSDSIVVADALVCLLANYCFDIRFRTKVHKWEQYVKPFSRLLRVDASVRTNFVKYTFFSSRTHLQEFLFQCPYPGVRFLYGTLLVEIAADALETSALLPAECYPVFFAIRQQPLLAAHRTVGGAALQDRSPTVGEGKTFLSDALVKCLLHHTLAVLMDQQQQPQVPFAPDRWTCDSFQTDIKPAWSPAAYDARAFQRSTSLGQVFGLLLDYAQTGEKAVSQLLELGLLSRLIRVALDRASVITSVSPTTPGPLTSLGTWHSQPQRYQEPHQQIADHESFVLRAPITRALNSERVLSLCLLSTSTPASPVPVFSDGVTSADRLTVPWCQERIRAFTMSASQLVRLSGRNGLFCLFAYLFSRVDLQRDRPVSCFDPSAAAAIYSGDGELAELLNPDGKFAEPILRLLIACCNNAGTLIPVVHIFKHWCFENQQISLLLIDELIRTIFPSYGSYSELAWEYAILILIEILSIEDSRRVVRLQYTFLHDPKYNVLNFIASSDPTRMDTPSMHLLDGLTNFFLQSEYMQNFILGAADLRSTFYKLIDYVLRTLLPQPYTSAYRTSSKVVAYLKALKDARDLLVSYLPTTDADQTGDTDDGDCCEDQGDDEDCSDDEGGEDAGEEEEEEEKGRDVSNRRKAFSCENSPLIDSENYLLSRLEVAEKKRETSRCG